MANLHGKVKKMHKTKMLRNKKKKRKKITTGYRKGGLESCRLPQKHIFLRKKKKALLTAAKNFPKQNNTWRIQQLYLIGTQDKFQINSSILSIYAFSFGLKIQVI